MLKEYLNKPEVIEIKNYLLLSYSIVVKAKQLLLFLTGLWLSKETANFLRKGWAHSGDKGYFDINENVFVVGRYKELIKYRNNHVANSVQTFSPSVHITVCYNFKYCRLFQITWKSILLHIQLYMTPQW